MISKNKLLWIFVMHEDILKIKNIEILKKLSILYIEDEDQTRKSYKSIFSVFFKESYSSKNGKIGLEEYIKNPTDIVLCDIQMPEMNGIEVAKEILKIKPDQKIVFVSAYSESEYLFKLLQMGISNIVQKPIDLNELLTILVHISHK